jgi:transcriptional regulator with XRE-family HTH domain
MSRNQKRHLPPAAGTTTFEKHSRRLREQEFSRRLKELLLERGWKQSDLARRAFGETFDEATGHTIVFKRDRISNYINGRQFPDDENLTAIAKAFDMTKEELAPGLTAQAVDRSDPDFCIVGTPGHEYVLVKMEKLVPVPLAYQIFGLLASYRDVIAPSPRPEMHPAPSNKEEDRLTRQPKEPERLDVAPIIQTPRKREKLTLPKKKEESRAPEPAREPVYASSSIEELGDIFDDIADTVS